MYAFFCILGAAIASPSFDDRRAELHGKTPLPVSVGTRLSAAELKAAVDAGPIAPYGDATVGVRSNRGEVWIGTSRGLMAKLPGHDAWRLFHSQRWLPDDEVRDLAVTPDGSVWAATKTGTARIFRRETTMEAKMAEIHAALRAHHLQSGLVRELHLRRPDSLEGARLPSDDNDGLWTSLYVAAEAFRYGATGAADAKRNAWESLEALMFLEKVTELPGFVARSFVPGDEPNPAGAYGGEWHRTSDGRWWWKGDTSSDELDGHYFAYATYYSVAASDEEKRRIRAVVERITDRILDHGYYYVGPSGKPTTWGVWAPEQLNGNLKWINEHGLNALSILSHLKTAEHVTGKPRYAQASAELIQRHGYAINAVWQKVVWPPEDVNHSDDELAFLTYYPLLWYERDVGLRRIYRAGLERSWHFERPEGSPLFNFIYASGLQAERWVSADRRPDAAYVAPERYDRETCLAWFRDVPVDTIRRAVVNSDRRDLGGPVDRRLGVPRSVRVLPISERMMLRWNADPYRLDDPGGPVRGDGAFILLPYWMGRYHRLID